MNISVLIGSRDRPHVLMRCLESVFAQTCTPKEVLVLDDNSSRFSLAEVIAARFPPSQVRCFRAPASLGVAGSRNFLMRQAQGDVFCVIDDDACFADETCISRMVDILTSYPDVGILAPKVIDHRGAGTDLLVPFSRQWRKRRPHLTETQQRVSYYLGTCHAVRRSVIDRCGGYQQHFVYGEEELDLSYRAIEAGFEILYAPGIIIQHYPEASVVERRRGRRQPELYHHVRNRFFLAYKYLPWLYIPAYLVIWLTIYGAQALKQLAVVEYLTGLVAGVRIIKRLERTPVSRKTLRYLKTNYGRLWY